MSGTPSRRRRPSRLGIGTSTSPLAFVALGVGVLAVVAGCGSGSSSPGDSGSIGRSSSPGLTASASDMPTGSSVSPALPSGGIPPHPLPEPPGSAGIPTPAVTVAEAGTRERRVSWRLVAPTVAELGSATAADRRDLVVEVAAGGTACDTITGVDAEQSATSVTVTVWAGRTPAATGCDGPQPAIARIYWIRVPLDVPLGTRTVLPGPVG
ncbi:MAG: hypothetical protein IPL45_13395 [Actinomycetales bacterium]|nr:hypothetical protein [Actinomycetales bacterium]